MARHVVLSVIIGKMTTERRYFRKMKITGFNGYLEDDFDDDFDDEIDDEDVNARMPYYCQKCNHNEDWPDCVIECRKWLAEL